MVVRLQRPLLVGGIGLTLGLWGVDSVYHSLSGIGDWLTLGAIATGGGYWLYNQRGNKNTISPTKLEIDRATLDRAIAQVELVIQQLAILQGSGLSANESPATTEIERLRQQLAQVKTNLTRPDRRIAITGGSKVGKSTLMNLLSTNPFPCATPLRYIETPALFSVGADSQIAQQQSEQIAINADLVLFLINGDLTATEYKYLQLLHQSHQRVLLILNQVDRYLPDERTLILKKIQTTIAGSIATQDIVITSTAPAAVKVRKIQADGSAVESIETAIVEVASLTEQLTNVLANEGEKLVWATTYRQIGAVQTAAKTSLNTVRRELALPKIEQNQWIVGAAAFANPIPALDLIATAAVNAQMVIDLGAIYQQKFSLEHAQAAAGAMGSVMLELGLVELCTQSVAGLLKTNAVTFVAGGLVQGLSAAYLTRIAGLTLVEYLEAQDLLAPEPTRAWNLDRLGNTLQKVFEANRRVATLQTVVKQGIDRLMPDGTVADVV
jgi:uncharacterized protein